MSAEHPVARLNAWVGWRVAMQTSEADASVDRLLRLAPFPDLGIRAFWYAERDVPLGLMGEVSWSNQATAVGSHSVVAITQFQFLAVGGSFVIGPGWIGLGYSQPLQEKIIAEATGDNQPRLEQRSDADKLQGVFDVRLGVRVPIIVTQVGDVDVGVAFGYALGSNYALSSQSQLRAAWLRLDIGWCVELW